LLNNLLGGSEEEIYSPERESDKANFVTHERKAVVSVTLLRI